MEEAARRISCLLAFSLAMLAASMSVDASKEWRANGKKLHTQVFHSPPIYLSPGSVSNKFYANIDFLKGHAAIKSLDAEVVDEDGISVPLHQTYLHHWIMVRYYSLVGNDSQVILAGNSGVCKDDLRQHFGLGSETRKTMTWVPEPYGIEVGNPKDIPEGYEERWLLNVHAIDTRGVVDRMGCTECRCDLYNVTTDPDGKPLRKDYVGGLLCCEDETRCRLKEGGGGGSAGPTRKLFLKYTVKWLPWDHTIVPVKIYILDVTSTWKNSLEFYKNPRCRVEYGVKSCSSKESSKGSRCVDSKRVKVAIPTGGEIVFGVAHQHAGGVGSALYDQNGRTLCASMPRYGTGREAGNEAGYIVGMSSCYPCHGSATIADGEVLTLESNYSSSQMHTGVMGLFYILVDEKQQQKKKLPSPSDGWES